jgi:hypothetical protein
MLKAGCSKESEMQKKAPRSSLFEPAKYRIGILGTLDEKWSDYCGGMMIDHDIVLHQYPITILTGTLMDQSVLVGVINTLYNMGYPIILVECIEDGVTSDLFRHAE